MIFEEGSHLAIVSLLLAALVVAADQIFKLLVVQYVKPVGSISVIPGFFSLDYVPNRGAAFSMLQDRTALFVSVTAVVCVLIVAAMFRYRNHEFFSRAACVLVLGGGIGNMIDRLSHTYVVDYLHVFFFPAIFNFGDMCVTVGAVFFVIHVLFYLEKDNQAEKVMRTK